MSCKFNVQNHKYTSYETLIFFLESKIEFNAFYAIFIYVDVHFKHIPALTTNLPVRVENVSPRHSDVTGTWTVEQETTLMKKTVEVHLNSLPSIIKEFQHLRVYYEI